MSEKIKISDQELCRMHITCATESVALAVKHLDCATDRAKQYDKALAVELARLSGRALAISVILSDIVDGNYRVDA